MTPVTATTDTAWTTEDIQVAGSTLRLRKGGAGDPLLVLPHDIGSLDRLPFYDALARRFTVSVPSHPGYDGSERPSWMRSVRDMAVTYQSVIAEINLANPSLIGLGFGGWIAAEMATMSPQAFRRLVLVGAMGVKPVKGEILGQALVSYIAYVRAGFEDQVREQQIIAGTPKTVIKKIRRLLEETRPSILGFWTSDGFVSNEDAVSCIRLLGQEVLPAVREMGKELGLWSPFEANAPVSIAYAQGPVPAMA